jgi:hypothetical protein
MPELRFLTDPVQVLLHDFPTPPLKYQALTVVPDIIFTITLLSGVKESQLFPHSYKQQRAVISKELDQRYLIVVVVIPVNKLLVKTMQFHHFPTSEEKNCN